MRCGAKTRSGDPCKNPVMVGRNRCRMHGAKSPRGVASPQMVHGRYSKDLPTRLQARYQESQSDQDLLNLRSEISLTDAFVEDALKGLDTGESGRLWRDLKATWDELEDANRAKDSIAAKQALNEIGALIRRGLAAYAARAETMDLIERRRKLVESEQKRRIAMQDMIDSKQAMMLVVRLTDAVMRHVSDTATLAAISAEFGTIIARDDSASA